MAKISIENLYKKIGKPRFRIGDVVVVAYKAAVFNERTVFRQGTIEDAVFDGEWNYSVRFNNESLLRVNDYDILDKIKL